MALDAATGKPIGVNSTFESIFGPYYKFCEWEFAYAACGSSDEDGTIISGTGGSSSGGEKKVNDNDNRSKFRTAINNVRNSLRHITINTDGNNSKDDDVEMEFALTHTTIRNVEMLT